MSGDDPHRAQRGAQPGLGDGPKLAKDYTVGWVCALPIEKAAAEKMLDEQHPKLQQGLDDSNIYTLGRIGDCNVVIAHLPAGRTGTNSAAAAAIQMKSTFSSIRFGLMVGVGGGVPSDGADIRLGDVVVSQPRNGYGGVVQHDFGKRRPQEFEINGFLNSPPTVLLNALAQLQTNYIKGESRLSTYLAPLVDLVFFARPLEADLLFEGSYDHESGSTCESCKRNKLVERNPRNEEVVVHYGTIASGNQVIRHGGIRDELSSKFNGILCFEMEAAGLMNSFPCLVIRGICDYADSHKNKNWQPFAAATAAAYAKELLSVLPRTEVEQTPTIGDAMIIRRLRSTIDAMDLESFMPHLSVIDQTGYESPIQISPQEDSKLSWIFNDVDFKCWKDAAQSQALWFQAPLDLQYQKAAWIILNQERVRASENNQRVLYFFFQDASLGGFNMRGFVDTLLHQIICDLSPEEGLLVVKHFLTFLLDNLEGSEVVPNPHLKPFKWQEDSMDEIVKLMRQSTNTLLAALKAVIALDQRRRLSLLFYRVDILEAEEISSLVENLLQSTSIVKALLLGGPGIVYSFAGLKHIIYDKERKDCMASLRFLNTRYDKIIDAYNGTFQWLWTHPQFQDWSASPKSRLLLLQGKPGSGKSTLMKYVNENFFKHKPAAILDIVARFFYSYRDGDLQRSHFNMLKSILYDILHQDEAFFYHKFQAEYRAHIAKSQTDWSYESLQRIFKSLIDYPFVTRLYIIIDAVDESEDDDRRMILDLLFGLCRDIRHGVLKVFMASRPLGQLEVRSKKINNFISLQDETISDISNFAYSLLDGVNLTHLLSEALQYIIDNAQGVFLWVKLVGDELLASTEAGDSEEVIFQLLKGLPTELQSFYLLMFDRMGLKRVHLMDGANMFQFVLRAGRPLTVDELLHGLGIANEMDVGIPSDESFRRRIPSKEHIIHCGGNFLEIKPSQGSGTVQIMHQTVREFFLRPHPCVTGSRFWTENSVAHNWIATACMRYLLLCFNFAGFTDNPIKVESWTVEQFERFAEHLNNRPFAKYALSYFQYHLDSCGLHANTIDLDIKFKELSPSTRIYQLLRNWLPGEMKTTIQSSERSDGDRFKHHLLHAASNRGLFVAVEVLLAAGADVNSKDDDGKTPFAQAAKHGHLSVVKLLMTLPNVNIDTRDNYGRSALHYAAEGGQENVMEFLMQCDGVQADCTDNSQRTPLSLASEKGQIGIVRLLAGFTDNNADRRDRKAQNLLSSTAGGVHGTNNKLLADRRNVDLDSKDDHWRTPLSWAAACGHDQVVQLLSQSNVITDAKDRTGQTPLSWAAAGGYSSVVKLLAKRRDVDADAKDENGCTPLSWAAAGGHADVVKILAQRNDVATDAKDNHGRTALSRAAEHGHEAVVKIFLARNSIQVPIANRRSRFELPRIVAQGYKSVMRLVVGHNDIEVDALDKMGRSSMAWAACQGHDAIVRLLMKRKDVDCNSRDRYGRTPLLLAAQEGYEHVVKLLLEFDIVDASTEDNAGRTPLSYAAERGHRNVIKLLLNHPRVLIDGGDNTLREFLCIST